MFLSFLCNPGQKVVNKFTELRKISSFMECFTVDFFQFS